MMICAEIEVVSAVDDGSRADVFLYLAIFGIFTRVCHALSALI
jgi:hypothetical protein